MTAITLNLLAEEQQAQAARAHDPLKIVIAVSLGLLTVVVASGSILSVLRAQKSAELQTLEANWSKISVSDKEAEFQKTRALAEEIVGLNQSRVLIAPELALVKDLIPPTIQLSRLTLGLSVETAAESHGEEAGSKHGGRPKTVEHLVLRLEGIATSSRPELEVDQFLRTLRGDARFGALVEDIQLRSISRGYSAAEKSAPVLPDAAFAIECRYKEKDKK
ncbi:MAG TPA: hypothetical protein VL171_19135 [Verrucomicrobiae bacterium]|nr:hypothetical protein [Verrucomicrobiae bacterium]